MTLFNLSTPFFTHSREEQHANGSWYSCSTNCSHLVRINQTYLLNSPCAFPDIVLTYSFNCLILSSTSVLSSSLRIRIPHVVIFVANSRVSCAFSSSCAIFSATIYNKRNVYNLVEICKRRWTLHKHALVQFILKRQIYIHTRTFAPSISSVAVSKSSDNLISHNDVWASSKAWIEVDNTPFKPSISVPYNLQRN